MGLDTSCSVQFFRTQRYPHSTKLAAARDAGQNRFQESKTSFDVMRAPAAAPRKVERSTRLPLQRRTTKSQATRFNSIQELSLIPDCLFLAQYSTFASFLSPSTLALHPESSNAPPYHSRPVFTPPFLRVDQDGFHHANGGSDARQGTICQDHWLIYSLMDAQHDYAETWSHTNPDPSLSPDSSRTP